MKNSSLWNYLDSLDVWRCPSDRSLSTIGRKKYPHVRTLSMNNWVGNYNPKTGAVILGMALSYWALVGARLRLH